MHKWHNKFSSIQAHLPYTHTCRALQLNRKQYNHEMLSLGYRDVQPGELVTFTEHFRPKKEGERKIVGAFNSKQLTEVTGSTTVHVKAE
jgi:hypothetical protein